MDTLELAITSRLRSFTVDVALAVERETIAIAGPSGAGKSTLLRSIAGLHRPDGGHIALGTDVWFDSARRIDLPPEERSVGLVFQDYALFPHLDVRRNVGFGGRARVDELLERFRIAHLARARPARLSGGERQRVALARALARDPRVLLLDEPLSALDPHTRVVVRAELQDLLTGLDRTTLIVSHSFDDAAALAGRVGVLVDGRLRQLGTPAELVEAPADAFVASFTGATVLAGNATPSPAGGADVVLDGGDTVHVPHELRGRVGLAVYPWQVGVSTEAPPPGLNGVAGVVGGVTPEGGRARVRIGPIVAECPVESAPATGTGAWATFEPAVARIVSIDGVGPRDT